MAFGTRGGAEIVAVALDRNLISVMRSVIFIAILKRKSPSTINKFENSVTNIPLRSSSREERNLRTIQIPYGTEKLTTRALAYDPTDDHGLSAVTT